MLDSQLIARDNIGFIRHYLREEGIVLPDYEKQLQEVERKKTITYTAWWSLLEQLQKKIARPALGVEIGSRIGIEHCGLLGYLFQTSQDLSQALSCFLRFQRLLYGGSEARIELRNQNEVSLIWDPEVGYSRRLSDELLLAGITSVVRSVLADASFHPSAIYFPHYAEQADIEIYQHFFNCAVNIQHPTLMICFGLSTINRPLIGYDQNLHALLNKQATNALHDVPRDDEFLMQIREVLARLLHEGKPEAESLAIRLNMSARTLHRRLKEREILFRDMLTEVRQTMAIRYLDDPRLTHAEIALMLAYQDQSAFSRAFKHWFGKSPIEYQKQK